MADGKHWAKVIKRGITERTRGPMALNRSPEYTGQSQTFNFEI